MPITYADIARKLPTETNLSTLGGESSFSVVNRNNIITIINSTGRIYTITPTDVDNIYNRYDGLNTDNEQLMAGRYTPPHVDFGQEPNHIFAPYVAKIIAYIDPI